MPYSDNLYSANDDESDNESFSDELSPADGFFNRSPMASSRMVPDPSLDRKEAAEEDKVLIPRTETRNGAGSAMRSATSPTLGHLFPSQNYASSQSNYQPLPDRPARSSSSNIPSSPVSSPPTENESFSDARHSIQGPPPAYTPSSPTTSSHSNYNRSYSTFAPPQLEQSSPATNSNTEPQGMGRPTEDPNERTPLSNDEPTKPLPRRRIFIRNFLFIALVFSVFMTLMTTLGNAGRSSKDNSKRPDGKLPPGWEPPVVGNPDGPSRPYCASATIYTGKQLVDFALGEKLTIYQGLLDGDHGSKTYNVRTSGEIRVRKLSKSSKYHPGGLIEIHTYVSDNRLEIETTWDKKSCNMKVSVPGTTSINADHNCVSLEITVWLPEGASLSELSMIATTLNIRVFDDIKVKVTGEAEFGSITGDIYFPEHGKDEAIPPTDYPLDARRIAVETISGNIRGIYPLYDYLRLGSQTGDITAGVYPQPVLPSQPTPAELDVYTTSGEIQVSLPVQIPRYTPPARDYMTQVRSVSGNIGGSYFMGSVGNFQTSSGNIKAIVLPVIQHSPSTNPDDAPKTKFDTASISGEHDLDILEPVFISLLPSSQPEKPSTPSPATPPNNPDQDGFPEHFIPIGDDDPYRDIIPPQLTDDVVLNKAYPAMMVKRQRVAAKQWRTLTASHTSKSANLKLRYPKAWEGTVSEFTISGDAKVIGKDMKPISCRKGFPFTECTSGKGDNKESKGSTVSMTNISGDLTFAIGENEETSDTI